MIDLFDPCVVHVLQDFEMLGHGDTAKVIGAGAAVFGLANCEPFARLVYEAWPISVTRQDNRTFDWDTVAWWSRQAPDVRDVAFQSMAGKGRALRLAVKEMVDAVLTLVPARVSDERTWTRIVWWAKPAAADCSLWMNLLREFRPDLAKLYGRVMDVNTLLSSAYAATGRVVAEAARGPSEVHAPGSDALASAWACARALQVLEAARNTVLDIAPVT